MEEKKPRTYLGMIFEGGKVYNVFQGGSYQPPLIEKVDITKELAKALKKYL